ncbi:hypothetical protein Q3G72_017166 [Acer saccharum]|nr:hypothetical protein Q3G72_017166 [Acer saccharum]
MGTLGAAAHFDLHLARLKGHHLDDDFAVRGGKAIEAHHMPAWSKSLQRRLPGRCGLFDAVDLHLDTRQRGVDHQTAPDGIGRQKRIDDDVCIDRGAALAQTCRAVVAALELRECRLRECLAQHVRLDDFFVRHLPQVREHKRLEVSAYAFAQAQAVEPPQHDTRYAWHSGHRRRAGRRRLTELFGAMGLAPMGMGGVWAKLPGYKHDEGQAAPQARA